MDKLLTPAQVAEILEVTTRTLAMWRRERTGPVFHALSAKTIRYSRADIDAYIAETRAAQPCKAS